MVVLYIVGDALAEIAKLPATSVDLVLTSPPFLALRSYLPADHPDKALEGGSQGTPGEYIDWLIDVVEACDRVLAPHGSLVFELGDTYSGSGGAGGDYDKDGWRDGQPTWAGSANRVGFNSDPNGFTGRRGHGAGGGVGWPLSKSLSLIPELFRFSLVYGFNPLTGRQTERWRLRNVIRWVRPNPPVGALGDKFRPATSELMVFCKSAKRYFDLDATRETASLNTHERSAADRYANPAGSPPLDWWEIPPGGYSGAHYAVWPPELLIKPIKAMCPERVCRKCGTPSRRIVDISYTPHGGPHQHAEPKASADYALQQRDENPQAMTWGRATKNVETLGWTDCGHGEDHWRPGLVLDPFVGSGTTLMVAHGHGRDSIGIDLDERNVELARGRLGMFLEGP